jgi:hypothetical protein
VAEQVVVLGRAVDHSNPIYSILPILRDQEAPFFDFSFFLDIYRANRLHSRRLASLIRGR